VTEHSNSFRKELWLVGELVNKMPVTVNGEGHELEIKWADEMVGVIPVFKSAAGAEAYAKRQEEIHGGRREVWAVEIVRPRRH